jgi:putative flippase GtrA
MFNKIFERFPIVEQIAKFALIGVMNTLVDLGILNVLMYLSSHAEGPYYSLFKTISFTGAVIFSYNLNKRWTFKDISDNERAKKFTQFLLISVIGAIINVSVATLVVVYIKPLVTLPFLNAQLWGNIGALGGTGVGLIWNFLGYKFIVFKK